MSTFAVFGMTRAYAFATAAKKEPTHDKDTGAAIEESEWLRRVNELADKTMAGTHTVKLSPMFDAPAFAEEWVRVCRATEPCRSLHVKAYCIKGYDKGKRVMHWVDAREVELSVVGW